MFGNPDIRTAEYASKLWLDGLAKWLMISGKEGTLTKGMIYLYIHYVTYDMSDIRSSI